MRHFIIGLLAAFAGIGQAALAQPADTITGAGSSAAAPVYRVWSREYARETGISLAYDAVGSSAGVARIKQRTVDFGASDVAPPEQDLARDGLVALPTVITGAVPVINLPRVGNDQLRLTGGVLARIFLGEITAWNAPEIRELNPSVALPALPIKVVVRADGSGTTYNFSDYLSKVSPEWKSRMGVKSGFQWPAAFLPAKGSDGVARTTKETVGAIGYVDYNYVLDYALAAVQVRNASGEFVRASVQSFREAVLNSAWHRNGDFRGTLTDAAGKGAWPITMGTFVLFHKTAANPEATLRALHFVTWGYLHGDDLARTAKFVPLPDLVQAKAYRLITSIADGKGQLIGWRVLADRKYLSGNAPVPKL